MFMFSFRRDRVQNHARDLGVERALGDFYPPAGFESPPVDRRPLGAKRHFAPVGKLSFDPPSYHDASLVCGGPRGRGRPHVAGVATRPRVAAACLNTPGANWTFDRSRVCACVYMEKIPCISYVCTHIYTNIHIYTIYTNIHKYT